MKINKRAVSPVIAVILIIALTVAAVAIVWAILSNFTNVSFNYELVVGETSFYDMNNNGKADLVSFTIINPFTSVTFNTSDINYNITVDGTDTTWEVMNISTPAIGPGGQGYLVMSTTSSMHELNAGTSYTLNANYNGVNKVYLSEISKIQTVNGISIVAQSDNTQQLNSPNPIHTAAFIPLSNLKVILYDVKTGLPAETEQYTDTNGKVVFTPFAGEYYARVFNDNSYELVDNIRYPAAPTSITGISRTVSFVNTTSTVKVYYSENDVYTAGATVRVEEQIVIGSRIYPGLLSDSAITDVNGTATFVLKNGIYRFKAYHGSDVPAYSSWINVTATPYAYIKTEPGTVSVKVVDGGYNPLKNVRVSAYSVVGSASTYIGYSITNSSGYVVYNIASTEFFIRAYVGRYYDSEIFKTVPGADYTFVISGKTLYVNMTTTDGNGVSGVSIQLYNSYGRYYGYGYTNSSGIATFYGLDSGQYYLRYYASSMLVITPNFNFNETMVYNITMSANTLYVRVKSQSGSPVANQYTYIYNKDTNKYLGYGRTNSSGIATVYTGAAIGTNVYAYTYMYVSGYWTQIRSSNKTLSNGMVLDIQPGNIAVSVTVQDQNGNPIGYKYVYAYLQDGSPYTNRYLDSSGHATLYLQNNTVYTVGIDYGTIVQTAPFNTSTTTSVTLTVTIVDFYVRVKDGSGNIVSNAYVYLYASSTTWNYLGYARTNSSGIAAFSAVDSGIYRVYVYSSSPYFYLYSANFTISAGTIVDVQAASITIHLDNKNGDPLANYYFYLYSQQNVYSGYGRTNSNGDATVNVNDGDKYYVYIYALGYKSSVFTANDGNTYSFTVPGAVVYIAIKDQNGNPFTPPNTWYSISAYYQNGTYASYAYINSTGVATLILKEYSNFTVNFYYNGRYIHSDVFNATDGLIEDLIVVGNNLYVHVLEDGSPLTNRYIYLYTSYGQYSGYAYTNSSGYATFKFVLNDSYYIKIWYPIYQQSDNFNVSSDNQVYTFSLKKVQLTVLLYQLESTSVQVGQRVYLRGVGGGYSGYADTNSSGMATISGYVNTTYQFYTYYSSAGSYVYSTYFAANETGNSVITILPVRVYVTVRDGANNTVPNYRVYMLNNGIQSAYATTSTSGIATVYVNNATYYEVVVSKYSYTYGISYQADKPIFAIPGATKEVNIGGGHIYVKVLDGNGDPIANTYIYLYKPSGDSYQWTGFYARTNSSGIADMGSVGTGVYVAYSYAVGLYSVQFNPREGMVIVIDASASSTSLPNPYNMNLIAVVQNVPKIDYKYI